MVTRLGIIGMSDGNGHPYSFASIINGYNESCFKKSGWEVIRSYLNQRDTSEFGILDAEVTHCWTQSENLTYNLAESCNIKYPVRELEDMISDIDGVIIARDDFDSHYKLAKPFLDKKINVFVDKPLALNKSELSYYEPFLRNGLLMSCSSFRFADEVRNAKRTLDLEGAFLRGTIINSWEKYGVHLLEGFSQLTDFEPVSVCFQASPVGNYLIEFKNGNFLQVNCLGDSFPVFLMEIFTRNYYKSFHINDNFSMFKKMLWYFIHSIKSKQPVIEADTTISIMHVLMAGVLSKKEGRMVNIDEIKI